MAAAVHADLARAFVCLVPVKFSLIIHIILVLLPPSTLEERLGVP